MLCTCGNRPTKTKRVITKTQRQGEEQCVAHFYWRSEGACLFVFRLALSRHWRHWSSWGNPESLWEEGVIVSPLDGFHFSQFFLIKKTEYCFKGPSLETGNGNIKARKRSNNSVWLSHYQELRLWYYKTWNRAAQRRWAAPSQLVMETNLSPGFLCAFCNFTFCGEDVLGLVLLASALEFTQVPSKH